MEAPLTTRASDKAGRLGPFGRNWLMVILCAAGLVNFIDRQILSILLQPIKTAFHATDTEMGLVTGPIFAAFYALAALTIGRVMDLYPRKLTLAACLAFWSVMTSLGGFANSVLQLALTRAGVAVAEAGALPASHSMAADLYKLGARGRAIAVISAAQALGVGLGVFLGGWLTDLFGDWRVSFMIVGLPGLALAVLLLTTTEPRRGLSDGVEHAGAAPKFLAGVAVLWRMASFRCLFLTVAFGGMAGYGFLAWGPTFLRRAHHMSGTQTGTAFGLTIAAALMAGNLLGGALGDWVGQRDLRGYFWVAAAGALASAPAGLLFAFAPDWRLSILGLGLFMALLTMHSPIAYTMGQTLAPLRVRATASVLLSFGSGLIGAAAAPMVIGAMNDLLNARFGADAIRYSMALIALFPMAAGVTAWLGAIWARSDYANAEGELNETKAQTSTERPPID